MEIVEVDGSYGEGGGQILRTAAAFAVVSGKGIHVTKIRSGRNPPGLRQQHSSALKILAEICGGGLDGAEVGSAEVSFLPGKARTGRFSFDLGTAASITLVLHAVVPAAAVAGVKLSLELTGGTDVPWSPTYDYFAVVAREALSRIGIGFSSEAERRGYYPRGGGRVRVEVQPCPQIKPLTMVEPQGEYPATIMSRCGHLPAHVAERQMRSAAATLQKRGIAVVEANSRADDSDSAGSSILVSSTKGSGVVGADSIGAKGRPAEEIGAEAAARFADVRESKACLDSNLADMVAPLLALSGGTSRLRVPEVTRHLETSLHVAELFTGCEWESRRDGDSYIVTISRRMSPARHNV